MKKLLAVGMIVLFLGVNVIPSTGITDVKQSNMPTAKGDTLYVGGNGTGNYTKIQDAIDNASDGDTVFVYNGTYYEYVDVDKSISLIGENKNTTIIGYGWGNGIDIAAKGVLVTGFTVRDCGTWYPWGGISVISNNNCIIGNNISGNSCNGIYIGGNNNLIVNNTVTDNYNGFVLYYADNNNISGNIIQSNDEFGIFFDGLKWKPSDDNIIKGNIITYNEGSGIFLFVCNNTLILDNFIGYNSEGGIHAFPWDSPISTDGNQILSNIISNNNCGISLFETSKNTIEANTISDNEFGVALIDSSLNLVYHNNFLNNTGHAGDDTPDNQWDNGYPSGGNFWDDYNGTDEDGDGIGDTPYPIPGGNNKDRYPLMEPYGNWTLSPYARFTWTPSLPYPNETILFNASESIDYDGDITLYEWDWDNDGEYDENHTNSTTTHSWSSYGYYPVNLRVTDNDNLTNSKTKTVRVGNLPPNEPSLPVPFDGATNVSIVVHLSWVCGDPDGDDVAYDVYFGNTTPPPKVASNVTEYEPGILDYNTTYYWQIVAWDNWGASTAGSIWSFTTIPAHLEVVIVKPLENFLYFLNISLFPLPRNTIIVGYIDISVNATSDAGIEKVEFYINNKLKMIDFEEPYRYRWNSMIPFRYVINSVAYGNDGTSTSDEIKVWKFF